MMSYGGELAPFESGAVLELSEEEPYDDLSSEGWQHSTIISRSKSMIACFKTLTPINKFIRLVELESHFKESFIPPPLVGTLVGTSMRFTFAGLSR
jgi:hypothetical protein